MYKVILVDDERVIRQGLKKLIDWENFGFEVVDEAGDGITAYEKIVKSLPDLVLLDIRMPGHDGVTLLKMLRDKQINCKVIFLTGYAEFEYAKKAIALDVEAFLTKPIDEIELQQFLHDISKKLDEEQLVKKRLSQQLKLHEKYIYQRLLFGHNLVEENTLISVGDYCVAEVQHRGNTQLINTYFDLFQKQHLDIICLFVAESWVLIFKNESMSKVKAALNDLTRDMKKHFSKDFFISVGRQVSGAHGIHQSFEDVKKLGQRWFLSEDQYIVYYSEQNSTSEDLFSIDTDLLFSFMEVNNKEGIETFFITLEKNIREMTMDFNNVKGLCSNCVLIVKERILQQYQNDLVELPDNQTISGEIYNQTRLSLLMKSMRFYIEMMEQIINDGSRESTIKRILEYINTHYDKDLKLERLGIVFGYNSSYLGTIFKQHTNMSFTKYLDSVRIDIAKKMLAEGDRKVYEISSIVGYNSVDYFHGKFKKYVKMSPKQYQLMHKG